MKKTIFLGIAALSIAQGSQNLWANQGFCDASYLLGCEALDSEQCLEKYHACGRYDELIQHFSAEQFGSSPQARYYKGVSYHGLFNRSRANSVKCALAFSGRLELLAFINNREQSSTYTSDDFNKVYYASKAYKDLEQVEGCSDDALLKEEVELIAENYAHKLLSNLFTDESIGGALGDAIDEMKADIREVVGSFVSKASAAETQFSMRQLGLDMSQTRLQTIVRLIDEYFGDATLNVDANGKVTSASVQFNAGTQFANARTNANAWHETISLKHQALLAAMASVNINHYEAAREQMIVKAIYLSQEASENINLNTDLVASTALQNRYQDALLIDSGDAANQIVDDIRSDWQNSPEADFTCAFSLPKPWYCAQ